MKKNNLLPMAALLVCSFNTFAQEVAPPDSVDQKTLNFTTIDIFDTLSQKKADLYKPISEVKLTEIELKRGTGLFLDDAINANVPGVFMEKRTISAGQQFNIRGYGNGTSGTRGVSSNFDGQGTKVYLNGIPITDAEGITVMDDIDFGSIGNVDIVKGPAGSMYGLAIAGAVNLKTVRAPKGKVSIGQDFMTGSYGLQRATTHVQIGGAKSSVLINYGKQQYSGFMAHTASHKDFVNVVGEFQPNEKQTISTYFGYSNSYDERNGEERIGQYDSLTYTGNPSYVKNNGHSNVVSFRAGISHVYTINKYVSNTTTVFGSGVTNNSSSAAGWTDKTPINYGVRSTVDMKFPLKKGFNLSGLVGVELQKQNAQTIGYGMVTNNSDPLGYNLIGAAKSNFYTESATSSIFSQWVLKMPYQVSLTAGLGMSTMSIVRPFLYSCSKSY
jgi:iron complex outermembrane receptor protein